MTDKYKDMSIDELKEKKEELEKLIEPEKKKIQPIEDEIDDINLKIYELEAPREVRSSGGCCSIDVDF